MTEAAILNPESLLYHEDRLVDVGVLGQLQPFTTAMFGDYEAVSRFDNLDIHYASYSKFGPSEWSAYSRAILTATKAWKSQRRSDRSTTLRRAFDRLAETATMGMHRLNGLSGAEAYDNAILRTFDVVTDTFKEIIDCLNDAGLKARRVRGGNDKYTTGNILDDIADAIFEVIFKSSLVSKPQDLAWTVQHNNAWSGIFSFGSSDCAQIVKRKVGRLLYEEIARMNDFPNYKGARILGYCLNVFGLAPRRKAVFRGDYPALHVLVIDWAVKSFAELYDLYPQVAHSVLMGSLSYEADERLLISTGPQLISKDRRRVVLKVDPPSGKWKARDSASGLV